VAVSAIGGQFYLVGGQLTGGTKATAANESYDPATDTWTSRAPMPTARYGNAAAVYANKLYVFGGANTSGTLKTVESYNPGTNTWSTETPMPTALKYLAAAELNGILYVVGGTNTGNVQQSALYAYDPVAKTWTSRAAMPAAGAYPTGARNKLTLTTANGSLWAIGGVGGQGTHVQLYNPTTNAWTEAPDLPAKRSLHGASVLNGYLYVVGGLDATTAQPTDTVYVYDPLLGAGGSWRTATSLPQARAAFGGQVDVVDPLPNPNRANILVAAGAVGAASTVTNSLTMGGN
jgi:N-acetylneuraminic acid mutarotase